MHFSQDAIVSIFICLERYMTCNISFAAIHCFHKLIILGTFMHTSYLLLLLLLFFFYFILFFFRKDLWQSCIVTFSHVAATRLYTEEYFSKEMSAEGIPEMQRSNLVSCVIQVCSFVEFHKLLAICFLSLPFSSDFFGAKTNELMDCCICNSCPFSPFYKSMHFYIS